MPGIEESGSGGTRSKRKSRERCERRSCRRSHSRSGRDVRRDVRQRRYSSDRTDAAAHFHEAHRATIHSADDPFDESRFVEKVVGAPSRGGARSPEGPTTKVGKVESGSDSGSDADEDGEIGPALPPPDYHETRGSDHAAVLTREEYELARSRREESKERERAQVLHDRKRERTRRREEMDELVPRADPGHARTVERKRALKSQSEVFNGGGASGSGSGTAGAGPAGGNDEAEVLSDALIFDDDEIKASLARVQAKRKERAELRAIRDLERDQERLGRLKVHRQKEEKNMAMLQALAKQRFG